MENYKEIQMNQLEREVRIAIHLFQIQQAHLAILEQGYQNYRRKDYRVMRLYEAGFLNFFPISRFVISKNTKEILIILFFIKFKMDSIVKW